MSFDSKTSQVQSQMLSQESERFKHLSVMLEETVDMLNVREGGVYVDGTLGGGGHSAEILRRLNGTGHLYGIDRDNDALAAATARLGGAGNFTAIKGNFHDVRELLAAQGVTKIDGMMIDLGVSSYQLDTAERGFSYHDDLATLEDFIGDYNWDFVQLQLNYYDMGKEDYKAEYELVKGRGIPVAIMEPVRGGFLARTVPNAQSIISENYGENKSAALALSYANSLEGVYIVLSGMSNMEQVKDNINTFKAPIAMDEKAQKVIADVLAEIEAFKVVPCTKCEYCLPCPLGIDIPKVFETYNKFEMFKANWIITDYVKEAAVKPGECIGCGVCASRCPQAIAIPERIADFNAVAEKLAKA